MVFGITFWQWLVEFVFNVLLIIFIKFMKSENRTYDHFVGLLACGIMFIVVPSFYFMADSSFRRALKNDGFFRAMWKAMIHSI